MYFKIIYSQGDEQGRNNINIPFSASYHIFTVTLEHNITVIICASDSSISIEEMELHYF